jgi:hypothetical protein
MEGALPFGAGTMVDLGGSSFFSWWRCNCCVWPGAHATIPAWTTRAGRLATFPRGWAWALRCLVQCSAECPYARVQASN